MPPPAINNDRAVPYFIFDEIHFLIQGDLEASMSKEPDVSKILEVRKNVKALKSKFRHKLADKKDLEEVWAIAYTFTAKFCQKF